jgi:fluoride ion exporter CrcB/FEX
MSDQISPGQAASLNARAMTNGAGTAAVLAAGIGSFLLAVFAILADQVASIKSLMNFYKPTGPLSGVTTCAIVAWLVAWAILHRRWQWRNVNVGRATAAAFVLLFLGLLLTFPPIADLF